MITVHTLVKNEENFIWYAINSVIPFVDQILIWDTGSIDKTVEIIKSVKSEKIIFEEKGNADPEQITLLRNEMLMKTRTDWIMILDGDEVWEKKAMNEVNEIINKNNVDVIIHKNKMLIGDMYHYQEEKAGKYKIHNLNGHYNLRFFRNLPGLKVLGNYPNEAFINKDNIKLQELDKDKMCFAKKYYLHASYLKRSSKDNKKIKYEIGNEFPKDYFYPEAFFKQKPEEVKNIWKKMDFNYKLNAYLQTPFKKLKRKIV